MRWVVVLFAGVLIGVAVGVALYRSPVVTTTVASATPAAPSGPMLAAQGQLTAQTRAGAAGTSGRLTSLDHLWVNRIGLEAYNRADADRDKRGQDRISDAYEHFFPAAGTQIRVVVKDGPVRQLEILDGPHQGKRGWTDSPDSWYATN